MDRSCACGMDSAGRHQPQCALFSNTQTMTVGRIEFAPSPATPFMLPSPTAPTPRGPSVEDTLRAQLASAQDALRDALHALSQHKCRVCRETLTRHAETYRIAKDAAR